MLRLLLTGSESTYILYGGRFTRTLIVEMVMAEGGLACELREIDVVKQEHRTPAYLAINRAGWIPALITPQGETRYETPAIALYLAERHGLTHLAPRVEEQEIGLFLSGFFYLTDDVEPAMKRYFYPHRFVLRPEEAPEMKRRSLDFVLVRPGVVARRLTKKGPYHLGDRFSLVDLVISHWAAHIDPAKALDSYPSLNRCSELVTGRPTLRAEFAQVAAWLETNAKMEARGEDAR